MTDTATQSFLDGHGIPVDLANIETELVSLWGPAAEQAGGPEVESPNVTRIVLANLLVDCLTGAATAPGRVLETVIARYPCRAIVLLGDDGPERRIRAEVSALCHLPAPGLPQVCSERIVLRAGPSAIDLVPGAVRPLLEADLPMVLWWTSDPRDHEGLFRDLADECSRLVLDLPDPTARTGALRLGLDPLLCPSSRDSAWFGITQWRELVAHFFDSPAGIESLDAIRTVEIEALSPNPTRAPRLAVWLAAWLAGQLGWQPLGQPGIESRGGRPGHDGSLEARFGTSSGEAMVRILTRPAAGGSGAIAQLETVTIKAERPGTPKPETYEIHRPVPESPIVVVEADAPHLCCLPAMIEAPEPDAARRIAAALESSRLDPPFQRALPIALWLLEAQEPRPR
jgi:glucose-6-phosphate dehydrogenase assembly protein OpcA